MCLVICSVNGEGAFVGVAAGGHQAQGAQAGVEGGQVDELGAASDAARQLAVAVGVEDVVVVFITFFVTNVSSAEFN